MEATIARNFELHCNAAFIPVPSDKWRAAQDSNHSCCQTATPSETELIAWTNLQSNDAICRSLPWEGQGRRVGVGQGRGSQETTWEVVVYLRGMNPSHFQSSHLHDNQGFQSWRRLGCSHKGPQRFTGLIFVKFRRLFYLQVEIKKEWWLSLISPFKSDLKTTVGRDRNCG